MRVTELVIAALLALLGVASLAKWMRAGFDPESPAEQVLYALYRTGRVGTWFAFGGFFLGNALVDDPLAFRWYVFVPIGLGGLQLLAGILLGRSPAPRNLP